MTAFITMAGGRTTMATTTIGMRTVVTTTRILSMQTHAMAGLVFTTPDSGQAVAVMSRCTPRRGRSGPNAGPARRGQARLHPCNKATSRSWTTRRDSGMEMRRLPCPWRSPKSPWSPWGPWVRLIGGRSSSRRPPPPRPTPPAPPPSTSPSPCPCRTCPSPAPPRFH